jgi:ATP-binding cassette subfamily C protein LapB
MRQVEKISLCIGLNWAITQLAKLQGRKLDRVQLHQVLGKYEDDLDRLGASDEVKAGRADFVWQPILGRVINAADLGTYEFYDQPEPARLPAISYLNDSGWVIVRQMGGDGQWLVESVDGLSKIAAGESMPCVRIVFKDDQRTEESGRAFQLIKGLFLKQKDTLIESGMAGVIVNLLALGVSLYSMQVYDRVIPTQGYSTLIVLTLGVFLALVFDLIVKFARIHLMESAAIYMDSNLAKSVFSQLLNIRLDQFPGSVGTLSSQLRGYETIRSFLSTTTFYFFIDAPFGIFFILMIALIATPVLAIVPLLFLLGAVGFGIVLREKVQNHAIETTDASNLRTGYLVGAIEGAETIKASAGGWNVLSKWIDISNEAMEHDAVLRTINEKGQYLSAFMQQLSYILLVAIGAIYAAEGKITMGGLIACSILSGRAMAPIAQLPSLIVQWSYAKASLGNLEKVYLLESDNQGVQRPLVPDNLSGNYVVERTRFAYGNATNALVVQGLKIERGERIGVIGPVGSGKSTLLRLLTGMYQPNEGRILLDGLDIDHLSRQFLSEKIGYLQQDARLFHGTLRENLLLGIPDPGDAKIKEVAEKTGLLAVITDHPMGLDLAIDEGGRGLSGGQRQLVAFTRLILSAPNVWLLDEPTASMDSTTEEKCCRAMIEAMRPEDTLILVTHKTNLLAIINRLVCIANHRIVMDGPRDAVLKQLSLKTSSGSATPSDKGLH